MFLLALLAICLATVPLFGGRLARLADIEFRRPWAGIGAVALQTSILALFPEGDHGLHAALHLVSYGLIFYFLAANLAVPGLWIIGLGGACNAIAIAANDGVMPALPSALNTAGIAQVPGEFANSAALAEPKLWFLGDVFALPSQVPLANVFSIGDILLLIGAFVVMHRVTDSSLAPRMIRLAAWADRTGPRLDLLRRHREFRRLWVAQVVSAIGDFIYPLAVFTAVVKDDTKASSLAFLLIAQVGPGMLVGMFGGPLIDRFSRKRLMVITDVLRGAAVASLLFVGEPTLAHLYGVAIVIGVGGALFQPSFQATLPNIIPSGSLAAANAFVGVTLSLAVTIGPLLGAVIVSQFGIDWGFTANALSFAFSAALVSGTALPRGAASESKENMWRELKAGLRYIRGSRPVLAVVVVVGIITLAAGLKSPLEPLFALRALDAGPSGYGLLEAFWGAGMIATALFASALDRRLGHARLLTLSIGIVAVGVFVASMSPVLAPVLALWLFAGGANTLGTVAYETLLQEETPDAVRGRVLAAVEASLHAGLLLGLVLSTLPEELFGADRPTRPGIALSGLVFAIGALVSWRMLRRWSGRAVAAEVAHREPPRPLEVGPRGLSVPSA
jgi:MFS family permease